ncbi:AAA family ATPase [bacterium]|nr:AAA family ATPase [bacterium]
MKDYEYALVCCLLNQPKYKIYISELQGNMFEDESLGYIYDNIEPNDDLPKIARKCEKIKFTNLLEMQNVIYKPSEITVKGYAGLVLDDYKTREIKKIPGLSLDDAEKEIKRLKGLTFLKESSENPAKEFLQDLERIYQGKPDLSTVKTGFYAIDELIRGFRKSELIILGGRPAMGKSTIGLNIAYNMAKSGKNVVFYSLEMSTKDLHKRLVKAETGIENLFKITQQDFEKCINASNNIEKLPLKIYDKADVNVEDIYAHSMKLKAINKIDVMFIDHLSILKSRRSYKSRYEEISDMSRQLKVIAKDLDVPVIALCQLNRGVESRDVKIPTMADLRDSGSIEQDADLICFIHRPEYYTLQKNEEPKPEEKGKALFSVCKNRRGGVGCVDLRFNQKIPMFY